MWILRPISQSLFRRQEQLSHVHQPGLHKQLPPNGQRPHPSLYPCSVPCGFAVPGRASLSNSLNLGWHCDLHWSTECDSCDSVSPGAGPKETLHTPASSLQHFCPPRHKLDLAYWGVKGTWAHGTGQSRSAPSW